MPKKSGLNSLLSQSREFGVLKRRRVGAGRDVQSRQGRCVDVRRYAGGVDDVGRADERGQRQVTDAGGAVDEVQGRVDVGAGVSADLKSREVVVVAAGDRA